MVRRNQDANANNQRRSIFSFPLCASISLQCVCISWLRVYKQKLWCGSKEGQVSRLAKSEIQLRLYAQVSVLCMCSCSCLCVCVGATYDEVTAAAHRMQK